MHDIDTIGAAGRPIPTWVETSTRNDPRRPETEQFIRHCFARGYGADIRQFMPLLMSLHDDGGALLGALGLRSARDETLFLEHYLERPVEQALASAFHTPVDRSAVTEVGNLAVAAPGGGRWLIAALTAYLFAARGTWVVFTIGPVLYNAFRRLGLDLVDLGPAEPNNLCTSERACWGSYYEQKPRVMAGRVEHGHQVLQQACETGSGLSSLWRHAGLDRGPDRLCRTGPPDRDAGPRADPDRRHRTGFGPGQRPGLGAAGSGGVDRRHHPGTDTAVLLGRPSAPLLETGASAGRGQRQPGAAHTTRR